MSVVKTLVVMKQTIQIVSGVALGGPGKTQALPNACCVLTPTLQKDRDTLIEQSNILLKQSISHTNLPSLATPLQ